MKNNDKNREQLLKEIEKLKEKIVELEKSETECKQTKKALEESEDRYRQIYQFSPDSIIIHDMDRNILDASNKAAEELGYSKKELLKKKVFELHPETELKHSDQVLAAIKKKDMLSVETKFVRKDGSVFLAEATPCKYTFRSKPIIHVVIRDITERKRTEEVLKSSEERMKVIFEFAPDAIYLNDLKGNFIDGNKAAEDLLGYKKEELIGKSFLKLKLLSAKDLPNASKLLENNIQGKGTGLSEFLINCKDGSHIPVEISTYPVKIKGKTVVLGVARDISERKQAEEALQKSEEHYRAVVENSHNGIFIVGEDYKFDYVNNKLCEIIGRRREEIIGHDFQDFLDEDSKKIVADRYVRRQRGEEVPPRYEFNVVRKDGEKRRVEISSTIVKDPQGRIRTIAQILDITERKQAEEKLKKYGENLEELVKERTNEVEGSQKSLVLLLEDVNDINEDLRNVNTMLDVTNKELDAFSYSVSHDLRAPLTRMDGFSKALIDSYSSSLDDKAVHFLNRIRASSQYMAKLIDDLLSLSRITREKVTRQKVGLSQIAGKIVNELKASEQGRQVDFEIAKGLSTNADRKFVVIILENLLGNAFKFTGKKKNAIIEFGEKIIDDKVNFFIKDNGAGFSMKYYDKIFIAFQRLHSDKEFPGSGIGLAIVQRIIYKHGGKIWAESEEGKGATFYFRFE